jgi:hypothetical protein
MDPARQTGLLAELSAAELDAGRIATREQPREISSATRLGSIGIPHDRSAREQEPAHVPAEQFEACIADRVAVRAPAPAQMCCLRPFVES